MQQRGTVWYNGVQRVVLEGRARGFCMYDWQFVKREGVGARWKCGVEFVKSGFVMWCWESCSIDILFIRVLAMAMRRSASFGAM